MFYVHKLFTYFLESRLNWKFSVAHIVEYHNSDPVHLVLVIPATQNMQVIYEMAIDIYYE